MTAQPPVQKPTGTTGLMDWGLTGVLALFCSAVLLAGLGLFLPLGHDSAWPDAWLLIFTVAAAVAALAKQLPLLNVIFAAGIAAGIGGAAHAVNDVTGFPFGRLEFTTAFGPRLLGILPLAIPGLWAAASLSARGTARLALRGSRDHPYHGYHVIGLTVLMMIAFQAVLNPFAATVKGWWVATSAPALNLASWAVLSVAIQVSITPLLLDKFPTSRPPNFWPLAVWLAINILPATGLLVAGRRVEALLAVAFGGIIMVLALRTGRGTVARTARTL